VTALRRAAMRIALTMETIGLWWGALEPGERVLYRAMALLAVGAGGFDWRLAFLVPGALFALVFFGFSLAARSRSSPEEGQGNG
jgi:sugar phosphate permease